MTENQLSIFVASTLGPPLLRPFPTFDGTRIVCVKTNDSPRTEAFRDEVEILFDVDVGLDVVRPVLIESCLGSHYPRVSLVTGTHGRHIAVGINYRRTYRRISKKDTPEITIAQSRAVTLAQCA